MHVTRRLTDWRDLRPRAARHLGLRQRLGGQRLERVLAWRHDGAQRRHGGCLSASTRGCASAVSRAPSGRRNTYSAAEKNFQGGHGRETGRRW
jgi:hypothetical protein